MVGDKRKIIPLDENGNVLRSDPWMEIRNRALEIEQRRSFKWVNIFGVPDLNDRLVTKPCKALMVASLGNKKQVKLIIVNNWRVVSPGIQGL